jgi:hypothetical protein
MTPDKMLQKLKPPEPVTPPQVLDGELVSESLIDAITDGVHYTSESMEEDFSEAVDLLMVSVGYLQMLRDMDKKFDVMGEKVQENFSQHLDKLEEFCGMWTNEA